MLCRPLYCIAFLLALFCLEGAFAPTPARQATTQVTIRVMDAETGKPLPARLVLLTSDGKYPGDRLAVSAKDWPNREIHGVFIREAETFPLPPGKTRITAAHGFEYRAETQTIEVEAGKSATVELKLHRVVNMRAAGWVAGDTHVHMIHGENQRKTSYADVATTCEANGLDFAYVAQELVGAGTLDLAGYQAECAKVSTDSFRLLVGGERPQDLLGHQTLLGVTNPYILSNEVPYYASARDIHAQGGAVIYVHPLRYYPQKQYQGKWLDFPGNNLARELIFDAFVGPSFDGLSVLSDEPANPDAYALWFNLLNRGLFVPVFADSDATFDRPTLGMHAPGFWTTYYYVGPGGRVDNATLTTAVRKGQTFATTGPLLQFHIGKEISGATLPLDGDPRTITIDAWLPQHAFILEKSGIGKVELIRNGIVVKTWEPHASEAHLTHTISEKEKSWYTVRVVGEDAPWQVGVASPIYFAASPVPQKRAPLTTLVRGHIYDFKTGQERAGTVEIRRDERVLKTFSAKGRFRVKMPLDAEISVRAPGSAPLRKNLLMDYGPLHKFLWYLESKDFGKAETLDRFERLVQTIDLEFPLGYKMPGSYLVEALPQSMPLSTVKVLDGPARVSNGSVAVAAVLMDTEQIAPNDTLNIAAIYRDEGSANSNPTLVVEARGYNPTRPSVFDELKKLAELEATWEKATDLGNGYKLLTGALKVPSWVASGPTGGIDISVRARQSGRDLSFTGLQVPLGPTRRALSLSSPWPTMPISWPDRNYGLGPFRFCNRIGREAQPRSDYRTLQLEWKSAGKTWNLLPARDARGCPDADDAYYTGQFLDQILNDQSHLATPDPIRPQPKITWPESVPFIDETMP
ncbi:MAG: CehA/McbA family metallohydrolase [Armatimonas sp.]